MKVAGVSCRSRSCESRNRQSPKKREPPPMGVWFGLFYYRYLQESYPKRLHPKPEAPIGNAKHSAEGGGSDLKAPPGEGLAFRV